MSETGPRLEKDAKKLTPANFDPAYPIADLRPAVYNPRRITEESLADLRASVRALGLVKPVIVTTARTIVAGHQRTRAMYASGVWRYQKFHDLPGVGRMAREHFGDDFSVFTSEGAPAKEPMRDSGWGVVARNCPARPAQDCPEHCLEALGREFDLPLPGGKRIGRAEDIRAAFRAALARQEG